MQLEITDVTDVDGRLWESSEQARAVSAAGHPTGHVRADAPDQHGRHAVRKDEARRDVCEHAAEAVAVKRNAIRAVCLRMAADRSERAGGLHVVGAIVLVDALAQVEDRSVQTAAPNDSHGPGD